MAESVLDSIMGTHTSQPAEVLEGKDLPSIAKYISSEKCNNVFLMVSLSICLGFGS